MTEHLTDLEIYELAAGDGVPSVRAAHAAECVVCSTAVRETEDLLSASGELRPRFQPPVGLEVELERRIGMKPRLSGRASWSRFAAVAAALLIFAAGAASHALWTGTGGAEAEHVATVPALAVQRAGTEYVAAIARLANETNRLSPADRRIGREVVLAAMSGAAYELERLNGTDPGSSEIHRLVEAAWLGSPAGDDTP